MSSSLQAEAPNVAFDPPGAYRIQLLCQLIFHGAIGAFLIFGVCVIGRYMVVAVTGIPMDESGILGIVSCVFGCMIVLGLLGIHDCTVEVATKVRRIKRTFQRI